MFCYQCEQTAKGEACVLHGVCGKDHQTATLQDLLVHAVKGLSMYAHRARQLGVKDRDADVLVIEALFTTVTNVNFNPESIASQIKKAARIRDAMRMEYEKAAKNAGQEPEKLDGPAAWKPAPDIDGMVKQGEEVDIEERKKRLGNDIAGLQELVMYGLKGAAAYADHAQILGKEDDAIYAAFHETIDFLASEPTDVDALVSSALKAGELNLKVMELLDSAHTGAYGHPTPTQVRITPLKGKAIVVSGHDLKDLEELLKQTEGKGVNIYTHGEMLPAHGYPELNKYEHLVGNYGGAWQDQQREFDQFPGAILMTTNCIQRPRDSYKDRLFTAGMVSWPGCEHVHRSDFSKVTEAAQAAPGFTEDAKEANITVGFGHNAVLGVADKVVEAVKNGDIKHFFLIGGCDGAKPGRNYYTRFAQGAPKDSVILTLACGKYRFNKLDFGEIGGIPRLLDVGQCNDAYSAIKIASALADAFGTDVNGLPLSLILSWYEQKAVAILLTLLHLGIKNIRIGPSLPAFVTPNVLKALVENFNITPIENPNEDLSAILNA